MRYLGATVALALVLVVLGASLSLLGYDEGLQIVTSTNTQSYTTTVTRTIELRTTASLVTQTRTTNELRNWIYLSRVLPSAGQKSCYYDYRVLNLTKGEMRVSAVGAVFWVLSPDEYDRWADRGTCEDAALFEGGLKVSASGLVQVPASGVYYFVFLSPTQLSSPPLILFTMSSVWEGQVTVTIGRTSYSMQQTVFPTRAVIYSTHPAGFSMLFYLGVGLTVFAGVALIFGGMSIRRSQVHAQLTIPVAPPAIDFLHDRGCQCDLHRLPSYQRETEEVRERAGKEKGEDRE